MTAITNIVYQASIKNSAEQNFCDQILDRMSTIDTKINTVRFSRKTRSFGYEGASAFKIKVNPSTGKSELTINLGNISNTDADGGVDVLTRDPRAKFEPDFSFVDKAVAYVTSDKVVAFLDQHIV